MFHDPRPIGGYARAAGLLPTAISRGREILPVRAEYIAAATLPARLKDAGDTLLGLICFGAKPALPPTLSCPVAVLPMRQLGEAEMVEAWFAREPLEYGRTGALAHAGNDEILFGILRLDDTADASVEAATSQAYRTILTFAADRGFPHILRVWNHFPAINRETAGLERYRQFCRGRHHAFAANGYWPGADLPAASALGTDGDGLTIYFAASRSQAIRMENPRQISAYDYPSDYGPKSPSFSRATLADWGTARQLFISGTASIVGHKTVHPGDLDGQIDETLRNLDALVHGATEGQKRLSQAGPDALLKVYLRHGGDCDRTRARLADRVGEASLLFLEGDICRSDLLVEIEALLPTGTL